MLAAKEGIFFLKSEVDDLTRRDIELYLTTQTNEWLKDFSRTVNYDRRTE